MLRRLWTLRTLTKQVGRGGVDADVCFRSLGGRKHVERAFLARGYFRTCYKAVDSHTLSPARLSADSWPWEVGKKLRTSAAVPRCYPPELAWYSFRD